MIHPLEAMVALTLLIWALAIWGITSQEDEDRATEGTIGDGVMEGTTEREEPSVRDSRTPTLVDGARIISADADELIEYLEATYGRRSHWETEGRAR